MTSHVAEELATGEPQALVYEPLRIPACKGALYFALKRGLDVFLAVALLVTFSPLLLLVGLLIKLDSRGPVIFAQERVGSRRRTRGSETDWEVCVFRAYKFRSMIRDADPALHHAHVNAYVKGQLESAGATRARFKLHDDPRLTRFGRALRKLSIDEFPQLVNVLSGDMSLVGPRPVPVYELKHYDARHRERFGAKPGITGLWQVSGRCDVPFEEMVRLDCEYVRAQSLWLDLEILARTIPAVLGTRGAE